MAGFNDLVSLAARAGNMALGGTQGQYCPADRDPIATVAIVEQGVQVPTENGMGIQSVIIGSFLKRDI